MIAVIFRWDLKDGYEQLFKEGWSEIVHLNIEKHGALGSRLYHSKDNQWISYSQWISEEHFYNARNLFDVNAEARIKMAEAIYKAYEPIVMVPILDHLMTTDVSYPHI